MRRLIEQYECDGCHIVRPMGGVMNWTFVDIDQLHLHICPICSTRPIDSLRTLARFGTFEPPAEVVEKHKGRP